MALTGTSWGLYSVYGRKSGSSFGYTYNSFLIFGLACLVLVVVGVFISGTQQWTDITNTSLLFALYMGTISTALSYVMWNGLLRKVTASLGGLAQLLVPVLTAALGVLLLSEKISLTLWVGGALILCGIYVNRSRKPRQPEDRQSGNIIK
jgi:drug/metabolite transporter (DMT)-like permease